MALETSSFIIHEVEPKYAPRGGIRADRMQHLQKVGYEALTAECKSCGDVNRVTLHSPGMSSVAGGVIVTCSSCGNQEPITGRQLGGVADGNS